MLIMSSNIEELDEMNGSRSQTIIKEESNSEYRTFDNTKNNEDELDALE